MARSKPGCNRNPSRNRKRSSSKPKSKTRQARSSCRSAARKPSKPKSKTRSKCRKASRRRRHKSHSPKCPRRSKERPKLGSRAKSCTRTAAKSKSLAPLRKTTERGSNSSANSDGDEEDPETQEAPIKSKVLDSPHVSHRDPNHYRMIELDNGFRALLISTCGYGTEAAEDEAAAAAAKSSCTGDRTGTNQPTSVFNRRRGKRERSEEDEGKRKKQVSRRASGQATSCSKDEAERTKEEDEKQDQPSPLASILDNLPPFISGKETEEAPEEKAKPEEPSWLPPELEPEDENIRNEACAYVRRTCPQVEVALTIGCGSLYDPPNLKGLSNLTWKAIERKLKKSGIHATRDERNTVTATTVTVITTVENLAKTLNALASRVMEITTNRKEVLQDIDEMDEMEEVVQCFYCWNDPMEDERRQALLCSLTKENHPLRHVSHRGNPPDLWEAEAKQDLVKIVEDFHREFYVGTAMTMAIKAPALLDTMDHLVTNAFYHVIDGDLEDIVGELEPFDTEEFHKLYYVKCTNPGCCDTGDAFMVISWALPAELWENHVVKPLEYISALISNRAPGGLTDLLKSLKMSSGVEASCRNTGFHRNQFCSFFEIQVRLTENGFNEIDEVLEAVFSYINFLKAAGPQEDLFREMKKLRYIQFNALGQEVDLKDPYPTSATKISAWLQLHSTEEVMMAPCVIKDYDGTVLQNCVELLVPEKANFMLCSCFEEPYMELCKVEPMYSTQYDTKEITAAQIASWQNAPVRTEFEFPEENTFISSHFCLSQPDTNSKEAILYDPGKPINYRIWYQQNLEHMHFTMSYVHVISPEAFAGPENAVMINVWCLCLKDLLEPQLFQATVADIHYNIQPTQYGILITVYSWNHHMKKALEIIISTIGEAGENVSEELFVTKKTEWLRHLSGDLKDVHFSSHFVAHDLYDSITAMDHWPSSFQYNELKEIEHEELLEFATEFCERSTFVALLRGNVVTETAADLAEFIENNFPLGNGTLDDFPVRMTELPLGERVLRLKSYSEYGGDSHVSNFYQIGPVNALSRLCGIFIQHLLSREMARDLRNREIKKLENRTGKRSGKKGKAKAQSSDDQPLTGGYPDDWLWMHCDLRMNQGIMTLCVHCEGCAPRYNVDDLECYVDTFMNCFLDKTLCPMQKKDFNALKLCIRKRFVSHTGGYQELCTELDCLYEAVKSLTFRFDEVYCMMDCLQKLSLVDVQNWFDAHCRDTGCEFRKLSVQLIPQPRQPDPPSKVKVSIPPANKQEWRARRKQVRDCTYKDYHRIIHLHKPNREETFKLHLETEEDNPEKCDNEYFITNLLGFKIERCEYPEDMTDC